MVILTAIDNIALLVDTFAKVYLLAIFAYIVMGYFRMPYSLQPVQRFFYDVCEPYLAIWRRYLPFLRIGPIDLTPMVAIIALLLASRVVVALLHGLD